MFERTRQWLREHHENKGGQISLISKVITKVLPQDRDLHELDVIVVTPESKRLILVLQTCQLTDFTKS